MTQLGIVFQWIHTITLLYSVCIKLDKWFAHFELDWNRQVDMNVILVLNLRWWRLIQKLHTRKVYWRALALLPGSSTIYLPNTSHLVCGRGIFSIIPVARLR